MADYSTALRNQAQAIYDEGFGEKAEFREQNRPVIEVMGRNAPLLFRDFNYLTTKQKDTQPISAYLRVRENKTVTNARSINPTSAKGSAQEVTLNWTPYVATAETSLDTQRDNLYNNAQMVAHALTDMRRSILDQIESDAVTFLENEKNQVSAPIQPLKNATFNAVDNVYEIASADEAFFMQYAESVFEQEQYSGPYDAFYDPRKSAILRQQAFQGAGNDVNTSFQFGNTRTATSINVGDAGSPNGYGYAAPMGSIAMLPWIPVKNQEGMGDFMSFNGGFRTFTDPQTGYRFALFGKTELSDESARNGSNQDWLTKWELSLDVCFQRSPLSVAGASPVFAFRQL